MTNSLDKLLIEEQRNLIAAQKERIELLEKRVAELESEKK